MRGFLCYYRLKIEPNSKFPMISKELRERKRRKPVFRRVLPPSEQFPPAKANGGPNGDVYDGCDEADGPPIPLFYVAKAVINGSRRGAVVGQAGV